MPNRFTPLIPVNLDSPNDKAALGLVGAGRNLIEGHFLLGDLQGFQTNPIADAYVAGYDKKI